MKHDADVATKISSIFEDLSYVKDWLSTVRVDDIRSIDVDGTKFWKLDKLVNDKVELIIFLEKYRNIRDSAFDDNWLNYEPCWYILLDCYRHEIRPLNRIYSVKNACAATESPPTTALRYVSLLVDGGYLHKELDKNDSRRSILRLTEKGRTTVEVSMDKIIAAKRLIS